VMIELKIFLAQFCTIFFLGFQQKNVTGGHYSLAFLTSLLLGVVGWFLTSIIATANLEAVFTSVWVSFIVAGPIAIITAMYTHPWVVKKFYKKSYEKYKRKGNVKEVLF